MAFSREPIGPATLMTSEQGIARSDPPRSPGLVLCLMIIITPIAAAMLAVGVVLSLIVAITWRLTPRRALDETTRTERLLELRKTFPVEYTDADFEAMRLLESFLAACTRLMSVVFPAPPTPAAETKTRLARG
jgi:hypothetical protein